jgi:enamine deaminase RidA (YjgF/YER057c/UK114 family)
MNPGIKMEDSVLTPELPEKQPPFIFRSQGESWELVFQGKKILMHHTNGLSFIHHLLRNPNKEILAIDLYNLGRRPQISGTGKVMSKLSAEEMEEMNQNPSGFTEGPELLDSAAKENYRQKFLDLKAELEEADANNDLGKKEALQKQIEALKEHISAVMGLRGKNRKASGQLGNARSNVTQQINSSLKKINTHHPELGQHLTNTIKTGIFCSYMSDPVSSIAWVFE